MNLKNKKFWLFGALLLAAAAAAYYLLVAKPKKAASNAQTVAAASSAPTDSTGQSIAVGEPVGGSTTTPIA